MYFKVLIPSGVLLGWPVKIIGHHNRDHRLERCFLRGKPGDTIIASLNIIGPNFRKLLKALACISSPTGGSLPKQYSRALPSYPPGVGKTYQPVWPTINGRMDPLVQKSNGGFLGGTQFVRCKKYSNRHKGPSWTGRPGHLLAIGHGDSRPQYPPELWRRALRVLLLHLRIKNANQSAPGTFALAYGLRKKSPDLARLLSGALKACRGWSRPIANKSDTAESGRPHPGSPRWDLGRLCHPKPVPSRSFKKNILNTDLYKVWSHP